MTWLPKAAVLLAGFTVIAACSQPVARPVAGDQAEKAACGPARTRRMDRRRAVGLEILEKRVGLST